MKDILNQINEKINKNVGFVCFIGVFCVFAIMVFTLSRSADRQIGDVRGTTIYPPTAIPTSSDCCGGCGSGLSCDDTYCECIDPTCGTCNGVPCCAPNSCIDTGAGWSTCAQDVTGQCGCSATTCIGQTCNNGLCPGSKDCSNNDAKNCADNCASSCSSLQGQCGTGCSARCTCVYDYSERKCHTYYNCEPNSCLRTCPPGYQCTYKTVSGCNKDCTNTDTCVDQMIPCPPRGTCPTACGQNQTTINDGNCGQLVCPATATCPRCECPENNECGQFTIPCPDGTTKVCEGQAGCGGGVCKSNCSCAIGKCSSDTCDDGCGGKCNGLLQPDCGDTSLHCGPYSASNGCGTCMGTGCPGDPTCTRNCSCASNTCSWSTCSDGCGGTCKGTLSPNCSDAATKCGNYLSTNGCGNCTGTLNCNTCQMCSNTNSCVVDPAKIDELVPAKMTVISPNGPNSLNPTIIFGATNVLLNWNQSTSISTDRYRVRVTDSIGTTVIWTSDVSNRSTTSINAQGLSQGIVYGWQIRALNDGCSSTGIPTVYAGDWSDLRFFKINNSPYSRGIVVKNSSVIPIDPDTEGRNHICDIANGFTNRNISIRVKLSDADGGGDIKKVGLRFRNGGTDYAVLNYNNGTVSYTGNISSVTATTAVSGIDMFVEFSITFNNDFKQALYNLQIYAEDAVGGKLPNDWEDTGRSFKVWDCNVPVEGTLFDASKEVYGPACPETGFSKVIDKNVNFDSLIFTGIAPATNKTMSVNSPFYLSSGNDLIWGRQYLPTFSVNFLGTNPVAKITDIGSGATISTCGPIIDLKETVVSAYSSSPKLKVDFTSVLDQESWFQTIGGGVNSKSTITDNIPVTCKYDNEADPTKKCQPVVSKDTLFSATNSDSSLIAGTDIINISGCGNDCQFGSGNNWGVKRDVIGESYGYKYFYDRYYVGLKQGTVLPSGDVSLSSIATQTGVIFVNGNLNIDTNKTRNQGEFVMFIVKGNINFANNVTAVDGIFIADGQIIAGQKSDSQLIIGGMLYSPSSKIFLTRGYETKELNNTSPAVVVKYRPDFVFSMPGKLVKVLSGWKEGQ